MRGQDFKAADLDSGLRATVVMAGVAPPVIGIQPVGLAAQRVGVRVRKAPQVIHEEAGISWETSNHWILEAWHVDRQPTDLKGAKGAREMLFDSLAALNVAVEWQRVRDMAQGPQRLAPWLRRYAVIDVRGAFVWVPDGPVAIFVNPNKALPVDINSVLPLGNMLVGNGPIAAPTPTLTSRFSGVVDLLNHGFWSEAVLAAFGAFEGWLRIALTAALPSPSDKQRPRISRNVRRAKLKVCVTKLADRSGWARPDSYRTDLTRDLLEAFRVRGELIHQGKDIGREGAYWVVEVLAQGTDWLHQQAPQTISPLPPINLASPDFTLWSPGDPKIGKVDQEEPGVGGGSPDSASD